MNKISSFTINHLNLEPGLYVSRRDHKDGLCVTTFDMRFTRPNRDIVMDTGTMHTIEHLAATFFRNSKYSKDIVYFGPMGCRTGFYLLMFGNLDSLAILNLVKQMCKYIIDFEGDIPGAKPEECGNYFDQNLNMAKIMSKKYLNQLNIYKRFNYKQI